MIDVVIIQVINVSWTKAARGGSLARLRNKVEKTYLLEIKGIGIEEKKVLVNEIYFSEGNKFQSPVNNKIMVLEAEDIYKIKNVEVNRKENSLMVVLNSEGMNPKRWKMDSTGTRFPIKQTAFELLKGKWGQIRYNNRFSSFSTGNWFYEETTINLAFCDKFNPDLFTSTKPDCTFSCMATLW
jgi:hypothetical protein